MNDMKKQKAFYVLFFGMIIVNLLLYTKLPNQIPVHWNVKGQIDDYMSKLFIFFPVALLLLMNITFTILKHIDPKQSNYVRFAQTFEAIKLAIYLFIFCLWSITLVACFDPDLINISMMMNLLCGAIFTILGNLMPKFKTNFFIGIKTPWTLSNETVWFKTHRMAGKLWFIGGILMMISTLFLRSNDMIIKQFIFLVCILAFVPCMYSYVLYRKITRNV